MRHADGGSGGGGGATPSLQGGSREAPGSSAMLLGIRKRRSTVHRSTGRHCCRAAPVCLEGLHCMLNLMALGQHAALSSS